MYDKGINTPCPFLLNSDIFQNKDMCRVGCSFGVERFFSEGMIATVSISGCLISMAMKWDGLCECIFYCIKNFHIYKLFANSSRS